MKAKKLKQKSMLSKITKQKQLFFIIDRYEIPIEGIIIQGGKIKCTTLFLLITFYVGELY